MRKGFVLLGLAWVALLLIVVLGGLFSKHEDAVDHQELIDTEDVAYTSGWDEPGPVEVIKNFFEFVRLSRYSEAIEYYDVTTRMLDFPNVDQDPAAHRDRIRQVFSYFNRGSAGRLQEVEIKSVRYINDDHVVVAVSLIYPRNVLEREIELKKVPSTGHGEGDRWVIQTSIYRILSDLMG